MLLNEFLEQTAERLPSKVALICSGKRLTFSQVEEAANSLGWSLLEAGFKKQARAIIYLENSVESVISLFAILKAGGVFVIINPKVKARKLAFILSDSQAQVLITDRRHYDEVVQDLPSLDVIIFTDIEDMSLIAPSQSPAKLLSYQKMLRRNTLGSPSPRSIDIDLASLIYTSGSSGNPKGVMLTHLNMVSAANSITEYLKNTKDDIIMDALPLSFDYGLYQILMAFKIGSTVILEKGFIFPEQVINLIITEKVTGWPMLPTMVAILLRLRNLADRDFSHLRYITSTGQALPAAHIRRLAEVFQGVEIFSMYGLTECKRVAYLPPSDILNKPGSVGKAMPNTEAYIVDERDEEIKESGKAGQLVVRGSNVMRGYWGLPKETAKALRPGRLPGELALYTGDLFRKDEEGYLYFLGRTDDIIKTSGHMVSPKEVENIICEMDGVVEAAVVGVADEIKGQSVKAFVHLEENSPASKEDILAFCLARLEDYAIPQQFVLCGPLPKNDSGKIQKQDLMIQHNKWSET